MTRVAIVFFLILAAFACIACGSSGDAYLPADIDLESDGDADVEGERERIDVDGDADSDEDAEPETEAELEWERETEAEAEEEEAESPVRTQTLFRFPLVDAEGLYSEDFTICVDHDPQEYDGAAEAICTNYNGDGFPYCYDSHRGTDYLLKDGFERMDLEIAYVYAAADGIVTKVVDGNYDRCHRDTSEPLGQTITCDGHEIRANYVTIEHAFGLVTKYYHLATYSILVEEGDQVLCGDPIGRVGSSGISVTPHLHFQVETLAGDIVDPYAGVMTQENSFWVEQDSGNGLPAERCQWP